MDRELKNLMLNINQLATIAGICRRLRRQDCKTSSPPEDMTS